MKPMSEDSLKLHHRSFGTEGRPPLLILHGLLGSSRNWTTAGGELARTFDVYAVDLRNHGQSPWSGEMDYPAMAADVLEFVRDTFDEPIFLLGHSMGGKTAMRFAMDHAVRLRGLILVDVTPRQGQGRWKREFELMQALPVQDLTRRDEADAALESGGIRSWAFRRFLLSNLERREQGGFEWRVNLPALAAHIDDFFANPLQPAERFSKPTLVLRGSESDFTREEDRTLAEQYFPNLTWRTIEGAGHNPHMDARDAFVKEIEQWTTQLIG